jgi:hypothetical protein
VRDLFNLGYLSNYYAADWDHPRIMPHGETPAGKCVRASAVVKASRAATGSRSLRSTAPRYWCVLAIMRAGLVAISEH